MNGAVSTRPVHLPEDTELLLSIYRSTRERELDLLGWSDAEASGFVRSQFEAQSRHYAAFFAEAEHLVVLVGGLPAGRLIVERTENAIHIVDISLFSAFRGDGAGSAVVAALREESAKRGVPLTCHVEVGNPARSFWQRMGFVEKGTVGAHVALERPCGQPCGILHN